MNRPESTTARAPRLRVAALIVRGEELLLVHHQKDGRAYWLLPGGGVDYGETLHDALVREVEEETGLRIAPAELLFVNDSIAPDGERHVVQVCFAATVIGGELGETRDERVVASAFMPIAKLPAIDLYPPLSTHIRDALDPGSHRVGQYLGPLWKS